MQILGLPRADACGEKGHGRGKANKWVMNEARLSHLPFWGPSEAVCS